MLELLFRKRRVTHPTPEVLVPFALGASDTGIAKHVASCATCRAEVDGLREASSLLRGSVLLDRREGGPTCPDEIIIADFVDGRLAGDARESVISHLLDCARCRAIVMATAEIAQSMPAPADMPRRMWPSWLVPLRAAAGKRRYVRLLPVAVPLAAAATLVLLLWSSGDHSAPLHRDRAPADAVPLPVQPVGPVAQVSTLIWTRVAGADRYRVTLFDTQGRVMYEALGEDTALVLPDSVRFIDGRRYLWKVGARTGWDRWNASELVEFTVLEASAP